MFKAVLFSIFLYNFSVLVNGQKQVWANYTDSRFAFGATTDNTNFYIATDGGILVFNKTTQNYSKLTKAQTGIPGNDVSAVCYDSKRNGLWITTRKWGAGVGFFNENGCSIYNTANSALKETTGQSKITIDANNKVWFGSTYFLAGFNGDNWDIYGNPVNPASSQLLLLDLKADYAGNIWVNGSWNINSPLPNFFSNPINPEIKYCFTTQSLIFGKNNDFYLTDSTNLVHYKSNTKVQTYIPPNFGKNFKRLFLCQSFNTSDSILWFTADSIIVKFDFNTWKPFYNLRDSKNLTNSPILQWFINNEDLWLFTRNEVIKLNSVGFEKFSFTGPKLAGNSVTSETIDDQGNVWAVTDYPPTLQVFKSNWEVVDTSWFQNKSNWTLIVNDSSEIIWRNPAMLVNYYKTTGQWITGDCKNYFKAGTLKSDQFGNIWKIYSGGIKTFNGNQWVYYPNNSFSSKGIVSKFAFDKADNLLVTIMPFLNQNGDLVLFDKKNIHVVYTCKKENFNIISFDSDNDNNIWLAIMDRLNVGKGYGGGLVKLNNGQAEYFDTDNSGLLSNSVSNVCVDKNQNLWAGTYSGGLAKFDRKGNWKIFHVENSPLPGNNINFIETDTTGNLWVALPYMGLTFVPKNAIPGFLTDTIYPPQVDKAAIIRISPNPFNDNTTITLWIPEETKATLNIYDNTGRLVSTLLSTIVAKGMHSVFWNKPKGNGLYFCKLYTYKGTDVKKIIKQ